MSFVGYTSLFVSTSFVGCTSLIVSVSLWLSDFSCDCNEFRGLCEITYVCEFRGLCEFVCVCEFRGWVIGCWLVGFCVFFLVG